MAFQSKSGGSFVPPNKSTRSSRARRTAFPKIDRGQPDNFTSEIGKEPGAGSAFKKVQSAKFIAPKRTQDPGHGGTPSKVKKGYKKFPRKQAAATHAMKSFGGQI